MRHLDEKHRKLNKRIIAAVLRLVPTRRRNLLLTQSHPDGSSGVLSLNQKLLAFVVKIP